MRRLTIRSMPARRSLTLFLALVAALAIWQVRLTWRLMEQDRNLAIQRSHDRVEQVADLAVAQLASTLGAWELGLREFEAMPPPAALRSTLPPRGALILITHSASALYPNKPLLFVPEPAAAIPLSPGFETAESLEFLDQKYNEAIHALRPLAEQPTTRGEAMLRIARLERRLTHPAAALTVYDQLNREQSVNPDGVPYALLGAGARCELLAETGDKRADAAAEQLRAALLEGRWPLRRETFEYYWAEVNRLRHVQEDPPKESMEFALLSGRLYEQWQRALRTGSSLNGREAAADASLLIWHATPVWLTALFAPPGWLESALKMPASAGDIRWRIPTPNSRVTPESHVVRSLAEAQVGGKLEFSSISAVSSQGLNRPLWLTGVVLMLVLVLTGAYAMHRGLSRELRVAQLQSDFVSAVSHEFRSPLTSLRGIAELLVNDRLGDEARRRRSYVFLEREAGRLQRLVEDLLDFGRMESGRKQYRIEPHDLFGLVRATVTEFREEALAAGFQVELDLDARTAPVEADQEALRRAFRNLLENAVKYSPDCRTVWVEGRLIHREAAVSVRDRGMGIQPREQRDIFQKFVRGDAAKKAGIKGTGIGLSLVRQIVEASGGQIRLQSGEGVGSTFTVLLPLAEPPVAEVGGTLA